MLVKSRLRCSLESGWDNGTRAGSWPASGRRDTTPAP